MLGVMNDRGGIDRMAGIEIPASRGMTSDSKG
jgi:hypothetical protein